MAESRRRGWSGAMLLAALALHNLEEAVAYAVMRDRIADVTAAAGIPWWSPAPEAFEAALVALTFSAAALVAWAARGPGSPGRRWALRIFAGVLLANILAPHVPAAALLGGYAPGLVTALAVNLPVGIAALWLLRDERV